MRRRLAEEYRRLIEIDRLIAAGATCNEVIVEIAQAHGFSMHGAARLVTPRYRKATK